MSFEQMAIGKVGYCLIKSHDVQHKLKHECWSELRHYLYTHSDYKDYVEACQKKKG